MERLPDLLTATEVADVLRVHPGTIRRWVAEGTLPGIRVGSQIRFRRDDVEALLTAPAAEVPA